ncbi:hypothetical protein SISNIDRAFT_531009 [Sistotremastrum niveocremeum HHB9708]|uniref:Uncharacterized protein n=1 Tax=Sistotremastrum niveocremeum HHB9708 TaxID=1314777 RepID=A0A164PB36_9AGAM|nr:hypothetical protein SISNIDRAFT_531009 [Sistotremastrum niveocremeum HHB9708]
MQRPFTEAKRENHRRLWMGSVGKIFVPRYLLSNVLIGAFCFFSTSLSLSALTVMNASFNMIKVLRFAYFVEDRTYLGYLDIPFWSAPVYIESLKNVFGPLQQLKNPTI